MNNEKILDISWGTILKIGMAFLIFYILYLIRDILIWFIFALIISILVNPAIRFLQKRRISHGIATIFVYVFIFGVLGTSLYLTIPGFIFEIQQFTRLFPQYFEKFAPPLREFGLEAFESFEVFTKSVQEWLIKASANIFAALSAVFGGIFSMFSIITLAIFLSLEEEGIESAIRIFSPTKQEEKILSIWNASQEKVSAWFGSRILACIFVAIVSYIALLAFKIDYPFSLALFVGIMDIVPIVGPVIAGAIIAIIAALTSWWKAFLVLIVFIIIQQIEGNILTPVLTKRFIGLPPALVLLSLMIGGKIWGMLGAILAIPLAGIIFEFTRDFFKKRKESNTPPPAQPPTNNPRRSIIW